ncbi:HlyD family secretion protein [Peteryoungia algae]|uniref:HlyD family efflux transporter periplasmic adaptor subunit n=1 Tax=Peteryoungia algae TaxID=2919917 RepID=A0ABT0CVR3_9HYPH|nr:HlyD family efflux transporter periplasmic adaptor subunit [Rhizobium sp. SSM4.3]MCJ8237212.1 HlyD family efflux transporter periplasmic adaptor subunit [Rhizobium sp. SSM4.3]
MAKRPSGWLAALLVVVIGGGAYYGWKTYEGDGLPEHIAHGNGRIEAVEIDISTKTGGRVKDILVGEGDFVTAGQVLAVMETDQLDAGRRQAVAEHRRAMVAVDTAGSVVDQRLAEREAAIATVAQREAQLSAAETKLARTERLIESRTTSQQVADDDKAAAAGARAALAAAKAQVSAAEAAIGGARAQVIDAEAAVAAAAAALERIEADIADSTLRAPRDGRVQYRVAQLGEVLGAGGRVLNIVDLSDVYMAFFLPTAEVGRIALGSEARIVLDAAAAYTIPARVSFVADVAQFTPKTVETDEEREKLMFRVKAQIPEPLLKKYIQQVKTGLPGIAYVNLDSEAPWPESLTTNLVQ